MSIETPEDAIEAIILDSLEDLHTAMYAKMATITGISGIRFLGFDSGKTREEIPTVGMHINLQDIAIDRTRPTPQESHKIEENAGDQLIESYSGENFTGYSERSVRYPLPVLLNYSIDCWCYSAQTQLQMAEAIFQKFPDRGVVTLSIDGTDCDFPIELVAIDTVDDLSQNLRERIYRYRIEAWTKSSIADTNRKVITSSEISVYEGSTPEDINLPGKNIPLISILEEPEE